MRLQRYSTYQQNAVGGHLTAFTGRITGASGWYHETSRPEAFSNCAAVVAKIQDIAQASPGFYLALTGHSVVGWLENSVNYDSRCPL